MSYKGDFNLFVGTKTGILKGVKAQDGKTIVKTSQNISALTKEQEITCVAWGDSEEKEILLGLANQTVRSYDTEHKAFTKCIEAKCGEGPIVGITRYNESVLTASASGLVKLWTVSPSKELSTGGPLDRMRHNPYNRDIVATGGKSNDLKLWNIEAGNINTFKAKNVPHNSLQLEVPVWVSDMAFMPDSSKIAVCTRYGQVRVYDPCAQRRPVINLDIPEKALISIAAAPKEGHVVVGTGMGQMYLVDLRYKGLQCGHFKGIKGSVRDIACPRSQPYVVSVSLDRHLRIHHSDTKKLLLQEYLKSKLNCVLLRSDFTFKKAAESLSNPESKEILDPSVECVDLDGGSDGEDMNKIFGGMETVTEPTPKKRTIIITGMEPTKKKKKVKT